MARDINEAAKRRWVWFGLAEIRQHLYVIGKTGPGKTMLLRNLILQLAKALPRVGLIDPHGDLADDLLDHLSPSQAERTVYFITG